MNLVLTNEKISLLVINIIFGAVLLLSYYRYIKYGGVIVKTLWGKAYSVRKAYTTSMIIVTLAYLLVIIFAVFKTTNSARNTALTSNL